MVVHKLECSRHIVAAFHAAARVNLVVLVAALFILAASTNAFVVGVVDARVSSPLPYSQPRRSLLAQAANPTQSNSAMPLSSSSSEAVADSDSTMPLAKSEADVLTSSAISSSSTPSASLSTQPKPIVYTIAGSDSGGGAGIQADLLSIANFGCHGCSAITCLTAQNSVGVTAVHSPPVSFLRQQLDALLVDLPPVAIKIGMLGTKELVLTVGQFLQALRESSKSTGGDNDRIWIVLDPVMISTSGSRLMDQDAQQALIDHVFPFVDIVTPNTYEAEALLGREILAASASSPGVIEQAARDLLQLGCKAVLIKGGHTSQKEFASDFLLTDTTGTSTLSNDKLPRLCDNPAGVWLQTPRTASIHTHGTGCSLSSSLAAALGLGEAKRRRGRQNGDGSGGGAYAAMDLVDACCLAKAYVAAGIARGQALGQGPGPVAHTEFPASFVSYPVIPALPNTRSPSFVALQANRNVDAAAIADQFALSRILPIVDSVEWVALLCDVARSHPALAIRDIQLRVKETTDRDQILAIVQQAQEICRAANVRLWINDYWEAAVQAGCFGVHLGQEDLFRCQQAGGLDTLRARNIALGVSTHAFGELAAALGVQPSYVSLGPVFATSSKKVEFDPQGLSVVAKWRQLIPPNIPLVAIGGINTPERAGRVHNAGADCAAVIGAVTGHGLNADAVAAAVSRIQEAMR